MFEEPRELSVKAASDDDESVSMAVTMIGERGELIGMFKTLSQALDAHRIITLEEQMAILRRPNIRAEAEVLVDLSTLVDD